MLRQALAGLAARGARSCLQAQHALPETCLPAALNHAFLQAPQPGLLLAPLQRGFNTSAWALQEPAEARQNAEVLHSHEEMREKHEPEPEVHTANTEKAQEEQDPSKSGNRAGTYWLHQPIYEPGYVDRIVPKHKEPKLWHEKTAFWAVTAMRTVFDKLTFYNEHMTEKKWLTRILFLETVAGVPGMVGAMFRHLHSLRKFRRDHGWIHTLLEEAENERMHLLTFMSVSKPGPFMRAFVLVAQGCFFNAYAATYLISPRHCHAFVGYLEEEAVKTYSHCLADIDANRNGMGAWAERQGPQVAIKYWDLKPGSQTMRDVVLQVRADEACHSHVNHSFSGMQTLESNPFQGPRSHYIP